MVVAAGCEGEGVEWIVRQGCYAVSVGLLGSVQVLVWIRVRTGGTMHFAAVLRGLCVIFALR